MSPVPGVHPASLLSPQRRRKDLQALHSGPVDVLVIGGGVTGCGVALDAASRGLSVALVERGDLACGTSGWSSKLVHGGLRYLAQGDVLLARESAVERGILMRRTAPHLVRLLPMAIPIMGDTRRRDAVLYAAGLTAAALLATGHRPPGLGSPRRLGVRQTLAALPGLNPDGLRGAVIAADGQLEDDAQLVIGLARTAALYGASILTGVRADAITGDGADVTLTATGESLHIRARAVISATGVWAGSLDTAVHLHPSKGSHLVLWAQALGNPRAAMTVAVPGERNRFVFALPQPDGLVFAGLTDDDVDGPPPLRPIVTAAETTFLLTTLSAALATPLTDADVVGSFAGLRPLLAGSEGRTADLSRRHAVVRSDGGAWSVVGGKLTTYRRMAQDAVDAVVPHLRAQGRSPGPCRTGNLPLVGAVGKTSVNKGVPGRLVRRYGSEAAAVAGLAAGSPAMIEPVADGVPVLGAEFAFGLLAEGARCAEDLLERRSRLGFVPAWEAAARPAAEQYVASIGP